MLRQERAGQAMPAFLAMMAGVQAGIYTALPGIIQSFDPAKRTAVVQTTIQAQAQQPDGSFIWVDLPPLLDCPVVFPSGGGVTLTFPVAAGDEVLVVFASRCIDAWWQSGGYQNVQAELRMHSLSDGMVITGLASLPSVIPAISTSKAQLRNDAGTTYVEVDPAGNVGVKAAGNITAEAGGNLTATAASASVTAASITLTGDVTVNGNLTVNGNASVSGTMMNAGKNIGSTHTHAGSPTAPSGPVSNTGQPI